MKNLGAVVLVSLLAGCAAGPTPVTTADGRRAFAINCDGNGDEWSSCEKVAEMACGGKYDVVKRNQSRTYGESGASVERRMVAACV